MEEVREELKRGWEAAHQLKDLLIVKKEHKYNNNDDNEALIRMKHQSSMIVKTLDNAISILKTGHRVNLIRPCSSTGSSKSLEVTVNTTSLTDQDGYSWRKYGQKPIVNAKHPREYYRCANRDQGCRATKQVQITSNNPTQYRITYKDIHTCKALVPNAPHFNPLNSTEADSVNMLSFKFSNQKLPLNKSIASAKQLDEATLKGKPSVLHDDHLGSGTSVNESAPNNNIQCGFKLRRICRGLDATNLTHSSNEADFNKCHPILLELDNMNGGLTSPRWCDHMANPDGVYGDYGYLVANCAELDGGFEDLQLWD